MIIYFVRHGQTEFNRTHVLQGSIYDEPLNETGGEQIREALQKLPEDFEIIFASPLKRVQMSAHIIAEHFHKDIITRDELSERNFGSLAGKPWDEIPNGSQLQMLDQTEQYDYRPYGGESIDDVRARVEHFLEYAKTSGYQTAVAVTSVGVLRILYKQLLGQDVFQIDNASVHRFEI